MMYNRNNFNRQSFNQGTPKPSNTARQDTPAAKSKLSDIDPVKLRIISEIRQKSKDKSIEELLPEIMKINQELNRRNMSFTKSETRILLEAIEESLSPDEKNRFNMIKSFMQ